ncbi:prepilin-type N-terminal cleavage/methylation domain-containing protein [Candidatus Sumerlaeota bacterium]|nr:prepilin-type N-terminal cleavage/methylation domain-containing protein [Candidatus Sumerlaeota bacterium]HMZ52873.1 prepilin-type N-terminal cleavage/methylation domain-containing protein [Candidatus Sumerlaeota bacterium]HNM47645.1 prepilin-type N-terminal cleavage/methylation domain-containing protein [Candidatus Sumerlaeota bacterium]
MNRENLHAFTLIELLVTVAVIAILAGIALPNFLEAQTRSKVSRAKADLRTVTIALEAYATDNNKYPSSTLVPMFARLLPLTTPVAYLSTVPLDVFNTVDTHAGPFRSHGNFAYGARPIDRESRFALTSDGPDRRADHFDISLYPGYSESIWENPGSGFDYARYDPTNGTISRGDIWRVSDHNFQ